MDYEWDEAKRLSNLEKHRVDFREMNRFNWNEAHCEFDDYYPEPRWRAVGYIGLTPYFVVYTIREEKYRIISLRKATRQEVEDYATP